MTDSGRYVLPLSQVQETLNIRTQRMVGERPGIGPCFELRGHVVPVIGLDEALKHKRQSLSEHSTVLIVRGTDGPVAIGVREIMHSQQIVVKPLGDGMPAQKGWIGTCVLGDGQPTLIVSPSDLVQAGREQKEAS